MESDTAKQQKKQYEWLKKYQWKKGQSGNPAGAKKGKKLKTRVAEILMGMTDEEMKAFLEEINPEMVWRMAEGNPAQDTTVKGDKDNPVEIRIAKEIADTYEATSIPSGNSKEQDKI